MAEEEEHKDDILYPNTLIAWERIQLPSPLPQFQSQSPVISLSDPHTGDGIWSTPPPQTEPQTSVVFPPTNHEGLNLILHQQFDVPETYAEIVKPSPPPPPPPAMAGPLAVKWWFLRFKLSGILSCVWNCYVNRGGLVRLMNFPLIGSTVVLVLFYLKFRLRRRRRRLRGEAIDELLGVIKEKDERIHQLLHQIARMNELLLASHHGVPMVSKATST